MTALELLDLLRKSGHDPVVLRATDDGPFVILAPGLGGRVMAAAYSKHQPLPVYFNRQQIHAGFDKDGITGWNNFGGAERVWLAPEGGLHGFMFVDRRQTYDRYRIQDSHQSLRFKIMEYAATNLTMQAECSPITASGERLEVRITRKIQLAGGCPFSTDSQAAGFESETVVHNIGPHAWSSETGIPAVWTLGQFPCTQSTIIAIPIHSGRMDILGPPVITDYFELLCPDGIMPDDAWHVSHDAILLRADGSVQTKLDVTARRSIGRIGAFDFEQGLLTAVEFDVDAHRPYVASYWLPDYGIPRDGAALSVFCLKGDRADAVNPPFFELESFSPAAPLKPGESLAHTSRTWIVRDTPEKLKRIAEVSFNADMEKVQQLLFTSTQQESRQMR